MTSHKNLKVDYWLKGNSSLSKISIFDKNKSIKSTEIDNFNPKNFFIPEWEGESLLSTGAVKLNALQRTLWRDAKTQFKSFHRRANSRKDVIYQDFLIYLKKNNIKYPELFDQHYFWGSLQDQNSNFRAVLDEFIDEFCFKAVNVYLYKIRFILLVNNILEITHTEKTLLNPNYFLSTAFKRGGSKELKCVALETNQYSWYRPSCNYAKEVLKTTEFFEEISISEFLKISQYCFFRKTLNNKNKCKLESSSHALSHKSFGVFLNNLLVFFPIWNENEEFSYPQQLNGNSPYVYNVKFEGIHSNDLAESHWLAQENNLKIKWSEILCPDFFSDNSFVDYYSILHELNFLSFLVKYTEQQGNRSSAIETICTIMRKKYSKVGNTTEPELNFFSPISKNLLYDRLIISDDLKSSSTIFSKIQKEASNLNDDGYLYVLSNQNLLIPSFSNKFKAITEYLKLEAIINFNKLNHKGEVPNHIYVLKKRKVNDQKFNAFDPFGTPISTSSSRDAKESCYTFNFKGELAQFNQFSSFIREMINFFETKPSSTTIFLKEFNHNLSFEYQLDAIQNGKLISLNQDSDQNIAHPQFLKGLSKNCVPFNNFFKIKNIASLSNGSNVNQSLLLQLDNNSITFPYVAVLNLSNSDEPELTIINGEKFHEYAKENGFAYFKYFGLMPKERNINIEIFHTFTKSTLGKQIVHLTFAGRQRNFSSLLKSFLVPEFFLKSENIPDHVLNHLSFLSMNSKQILDIDEGEELEYFNSFEHILKKIQEEYPLNMIKHLSFFQLNTIKASESIGHEFNFSNPFIYEKISQKKLFSVYPENSDLFIDFIKDGTELNEAILEDIVLIENESTPYLQLSDNRGPILNLYSDIILLDFVKFVLNFAKGNAIDKVLIGLKIPSLEDLQSIKNIHSNKFKDFSELSTLTHQFINKLFYQELIEN